MIQITDVDAGLELFKTLGSDIRLRIIKVLMEEGAMNMNELAGRLGITNGALTPHVHRLEAAHLINISSSDTGHGNQKICSVRRERILIDFAVPEKENDVFTTELQVGRYTGYNVYPTCGLATREAVIGEVDDVRYFDHPDRFNAEILWFTQGYVEYTVPNLIPNHSVITQLALSMELSSEAPGIDNDWPSEISFEINGENIGVWTSPGDFGDVPGIFTPDWWPRNWNQYGLLKLLVINEAGTYLDGLKISDVTTQTLRLTDRSSIRFRLTAGETNGHYGGLTLFGSAFGNYSQGIIADIHYRAAEE